MSDHPDNGQYVRRVVLPSGRTIEVVYFETLGRDLPPTTLGDQSTRALHFCPDCHRDLVYPVEWQETSETHWEVVLRCPNCEWREVGHFDQATVDRFDEELDVGTEILIADLKRLQQANMEDEIDRFVRALNAGALLPEDF